MNSKNIVALSLFVLSLTLLVLLPPLGFFLVIQACIVFCLFEFYRLSGLHKPRSPLFLGFLISCSFLFNAPEVCMVVLSLVLMLYMSGYIFSSSPSAPEIVKMLSIVVLGWLYIPFLMGHFVLIRFMSNGQDLALIVFLLTALRNIFAGLLGPYFRGNPISRFSLRKTYRGAFTGCLLSTGSVCCLSQVGLSSVPLRDVLALGILVGVFGQAGDIVESIFKRAAGVESSSGALLGQGGVLDTVDSFAFTAPAAYYYCILIPS